MPVDAFLKLWKKGGELLVGESSDDNLKGAIEVASFSLDCLSMTPHKKKKKKHKGEDDDEEATTTEPNSKQIFTLKIKKEMDQSSPLLVKSYSVNRTTEIEPFEKGVLFVRKPGSHNFIFLRLTFLGLYVLEYTVDVKGDGGVPDEDLVFGFAVVGFQYIPQNADGGRGKSKFAGWDLRTKMPNAHPA